MQAAEARERWREEQGAMGFQMPEAKVRVVQPHSPASIVQVHASGSATGNQPSQRLVSEMMILAGQAIAHIGKACTDCVSLVSRAPVNLLGRRCHCRRCQIRFVDGQDSHHLVSEMKFPG